MILCSDGFKRVEDAFPTPLSQTQLKSFLQLCNSFLCEIECPGFVASNRTISEISQNFQTAQDIHMIAAQKSNPKSSSKIPDVSIPTSFRLTVLCSGSGVELQQRLHPAAAKLGSWSPDVVQKWGITTR
jgi:hypothetical protein